VVVQGTASFIEKGSEFERLYRIFYKNYAWVRPCPGRRARRRL